MRLLNCETRRLEIYDEANIPLYAILSHTWGDDEVLFEDFESSRPLQYKKGWPKVEWTCREALKQGLDYVWVDSCCIDKRSSAELSEAINSMFRWYAKAVICYAYLSDYTVSANPWKNKDITSCYWFKRGWTLQELIAPSHLTFFDRNWATIGTKEELSQQINEKTNIDRDILEAKGFEKIRALLDECSVAKRMSWASSRTTKRLEDMAYCLLGIFDINMPMLYGEGRRSFIRLQEEIIRESNDMTIFAWQSQNEPNCALKDGDRGIFARSPAEFVDAYRFIPYKNQRTIPEYTMTNKGLKIDIQVKPSQK
ncbi:heterokaryon incompatibility protein-domain-containing protein, partial [Stachybotrys elegans]